MPKAGTIRVSIRPFDARSIAKWLEADPPPTDSLFSRSKAAGSNQYGELIKQVRSFGRRKRRAGLFLPVFLEISREDAARLAPKVRVGGIFGASRRTFLPDYMKDLCWQCSVALSLKRGAKTLRSSALEAAISRQIRNANDPNHSVDVRWLKRLRKRKRHDDQFKAAAIDLSSLLSAAIGSRTD